MMGEDMRISGWSSDVCSSDLHRLGQHPSAKGLDLNAAGTGFWFVQANVVQGFTQLTMNHGRCAGYGQSAAVLHEIEQGFKRVALQHGFECKLAIAAGNIK